MMEERIIKALKESKNGYLSGEELSGNLGITRAGVWKQIERLRHIGYNIEAQPHLGYRIAGFPDKLLAHEISWGLKTRIIGKHISSYENLSSTNNTAYKLAEDGAKEGTVVLSETQSAGKGRIGRAWLSPKGGIYLSLILRPAMPPIVVSKLTLAAAVSVAETVIEVTGLRASIKWPNDILIDGRKLSGILTELKAEQDATAFVIVGIGINVNIKTLSLPKNATSISKELKNNFSRIDLTRRLLERIEARYILFKNGGFSDIIIEWKNLSATLGKRVKVHCGGRVLEGQAIDIDEGGALVVRLDNGLREHVLAGDVTLVR